jgi:MFS family permease
MPPEGLLAVAALIIALKAWHGWRLGVVRQAIGLLALAAAVVAGIVGAPIAEPMLDSFPEVPDAARILVAGVLLGVTVYLVITLFSAVLFKKTEHQTIGVIRFGYGLGGVVLGAIAGALLAAVSLTAFLATNGHPEILDHLRDGDIEKALASATGKPEKKPGNSHKR